MRLYHNPRCSKSREALNLLKTRGIEFEEYRYIQCGIDPEDIKILIKLEGIIRENDLDSVMEFNPENKLQIENVLKTDPQLMQRPILIHNGKAVIGRPPELILTLLP